MMAATVHLYPAQWQVPVGEVCWLHCQASSMIDLSRCVSLDVSSRVYDKLLEQFPESILVADSGSLLALAKHHGRID